MKNIALLLAYNGSAYHGWQQQENAKTVQETLLCAVQKIFLNPGAIYGCGRTDAGVHAVNYVCNFKCDTKIPEDKIPYALNSLLPADIRVKKAIFTADDFHSRFNVLKKRYIYKIINQPIGDVFSIGYAWHVKQKLDFEKMKSACLPFLGTHDFAAFRASGSDTKTSVRTIYELDVKKDDSNIEVSVCANGFLYNMVRIITGTLVYAGLGKIDVCDIEKIINDCDRRKAGITAPPQGLYMYDVEYDEKFKINW